VVIDIRVGSPTFGEWDAVSLNSADRRAVYISEGLGHAFMALEDDTTLTYLCSTGYNPTGEFATNPLDPELTLPWPVDLSPALSDKDAAAPTLTQAAAAGQLPSYDECMAFYESLRRDQ
jgi:dTDP-4-dehydrorhamnose 3,5-epimerase